VERRTFLVLTATAVGLAGCTTDPPEPAPPGPPASRAPSDPDARLRAEVAASEVALIAAHRAAIQANPELADDLAPFVVQHQAHLDRVVPGFAGGGGTPSASTTNSLSASPTASPSGSAGPTTSPSGTTDETSEASASSVLAALADAESAAQAERATACDGAQDPGLARDLCLIAASEAQHATTLEVLAATGSGS
jgi:hypothetical protein